MPNNPATKKQRIYEVAKELGIDKSAASRRVSVAIEAGYVLNLEEKKGRPLRLVVVYTPGGAETGLDQLPDARILEPGVASSWSQST